MRPTYIPPTYTTSSGTTTTIFYEPTRRGYGYWSGGGIGLGDFILYDMLADAAASHRVMAQKGYYVGSPPPVDAGVWFVVIILSIIGLFIVIGLIVGFSNRS